MDFAYGPDNQRVVQDYWNSTQSVSHDYFAGLLDVAHDWISNGTDYRHYIYADSEPVAVYSRKDSGINTLSYFHPDQQGSIAAITNSAGVNAVSESFTPFGARRNPATWSGPATNSDPTTADAISDQGYTFQTQLGLWMGLNHMNGRVQDAVLGRFLSPDPTIPDPTDSQSYNRYSYVVNNPLTYVDPSGFAKLPPMVNQSCTNGYVASPCQTTNSDPLEEVVISAPRLWPVFDDSAWMCPEGACLADFIWPTVSYQFNNSSGSQQTADPKATSTTPNDPKDKATNQTSCGFSDMFANAGDVPVTSDYGPRVDPISGSSGEFHSGLDFGVPVGTDWLSPIDGQVAFAGVTGLGGGTVVVQGTGSFSPYRIGGQHLSVLSVVSGQNVVQGDLLGQTGGMPGAYGAGRSTGPHLHFYVRQDGAMINPRTCVTNQVQGAK